MCLYPKIIRNRKYIANKQNGGVVPVPKDNRMLWVPAGCGKCMECRKKKAREWMIRLNEELRVNNECWFVTLSFSDDSLYDIENGIGLDGIQREDNMINGLDGYDLDNEIATKASRFFFERWRKKYKKSVKHWMVSELGQKKSERLHLHGLLWCDKEKIKELENIWKYGNVYVGNYVNERTVNYIVKYISDVDEKHVEFNPKMLASPGLGKGYLKREDSKRHSFKESETVEEYRYRDGVKGALPIYYRNKLWSDEEREDLWISKLDKQERWVNGIRVDISKGEDLYYKVLKEQQSRNRMLGYGDNSINWERKRYERERRNLKKLDRIRKIEKKG